MRDYILKQYTNLSPDSIVLGHHGSIHFKSFFLTLGLLILLWILYSISQYFFPSIILIVWILAIIAIIIYISFLLQFLNNYLDAIVINKQGIMIFEWNKIFNYSLQHCHRDNIDSISQSQTSVSDKIFSKGTINIVLDHGITVSFSNINDPQRVASLLWEKKIFFENKITTSSTPALGDQSGHEKFDILVETLGEVIKEYMDKDRTKRNNPDKRSM